MRKIVLPAAALALFALAGTAAAQEAYGHWGYDNDVVTKDPVTTGAVTVKPARNSSADHRFRWSRSNLAAPSVAKDRITTSATVPAADPKPYPPHRFNWE